MSKEKSKLKELREQAGKSCAEVAKNLNITVSALLHYENGLRRLNIEQVKPLAELYGVSADEIIESAIQSINIRKTN